MKNEENWALAFRMTVCCGFAKNAKNVRALQNDRTYMYVTNRPENDLRSIKSAIIVIAVVKLHRYVIMQRLIPGGLCSRNLSSQMPHIYFDTKLKNFRPEKGKDKGEGGK